eukprot:g12305.t1
MQQQQQQQYQSVLQKHRQSARAVQQRQCELGEGQHVGPLPQYHTWTGGDGFVGHKINIPHVTPREDQMARGTCWVFATIGILEWSYRAHGIKKGWLRPEEYVAFNEQAYGIVVVQRCKQNPALCLIPDDNIWLGSTEGGEIPLLYSLPNMGRAVVPNSVCPYQEFGGFKNEEQCDGLEDALRTNPLNFTLKSMTTLYEVEAIKKHLRKHQRVLGISTVMTDVQFYKPCLGTILRDNPKKCARDEYGQCRINCPLDRFPPNMCCVTVVTENYNREGEFFTRGPTDILDGGHAMQIVGYNDMIVGYNDMYVAVDGSEGGFILKNNWLTNASHSIGYFMQDISRWDENIMCPNSANPRNWFTCKKLEVCTSEKSKLYAAVTSQPRVLRCIDSKHCHVSDDVDYFVKNYSVVGDNMYQICLIKHDRANEHNNGEACLMPLVLDTLADLLTPRDAVANDPDQCGFFFMPYDWVKKIWARFQNSYATDFEIE